MAEGFGGGAGFANNEKKSFFPGERGKGGGDEVGVEVVEKKEFAFLGREGVKDSLGAEAGAADAD